MGERARAVAPGWLIEQLVYVFAVLAVWAVAWTQWFEIRERQARHRIFKASRTFHAGPRGRAAAPAESVAGSAAAAAADAMDASDVPGVKVLLNRVSLAVLLVFLTRAVDPHGAGGKLGRHARQTLARLSSNLLLSATIHVFFCNIGLGLGIMRLKVPRGARLGVAALIGLLWVVAAATMVARFWTLDAFWTQGVAIWTQGLGVAFCAAEVHAGVRLLRAADRQFAATASAAMRKRLPVLATAIGKLVATRTWVVLISAVLVPLTGLAGYRLLATDENVLEASRPDYAHWSLGENLFLWMELAACCVMVWYAAIPRRSRGAGPAASAAEFSARHSTRSESLSLGSTL